MCIRTSACKEKILDFLTRRLIIADRESITIDHAIQRFVSFANPYACRGSVKLERLSVASSEILLFGVTPREPKRSSDILFTL